MSLLSNVTSGKQIGAQIHVIAGVNGVGKTTWAAQFPNCLIIDLENGSGHLDAQRLSAEKVPNLTVLREVLAELIDGKHDYQTITIDSVEALDVLINKAVCQEYKVDSLEDCGYGKGYARSRELMVDMMREFLKLKAKGITVILVAHTQVKPHTEPATNQTYDRWIMRLNDKSAAIIRDYADNIFFATHKVYTTIEGGKTKAYGDGQRVMYTGWRAGYDAKNRLELPHELPLSYDAFVEACEAKAGDTTEAILEDIQEMAESVDEKLRATVAEQLEKYKNDRAKLKEIKNRLMKYVG
jgi:hypothetical protein